MTDADAGATERASPVDADESSPLILLIDPDDVRRAERAEDLRQSWARVAELQDATRLDIALRAVAVGAIVVCADDSTRCQRLVHECRAQITASGQCVPLIAWQTDPCGPCGSSATMLHIGADSVLDAPSTTTDLLATAYALRRLMRNALLRG